MIMAKKYKRSVASSSSARSETTDVVANEKAGSVFARRSSVAEFNPDHSYVIKELKRIGTLAGSFFLVLVVLSFFINK
jgi:hypothetical protein